MRRATLFILGLCFLTSMSRPGFSEKPLRLFFEKNLDAQPKTGDEHTVRQDEWLFKILSEKGLTGSQIQRMMPEIRAMNPHIPDLDRLRPGQVIRIPEGMPTAPPPPPRPATDVPPDSYEKKAYVVQSGDTLVEILQAQGVPTKLIFGNYLNLFLELNPSVPDTNTLRAGQEILLPVVKGAAPVVEPSSQEPPAPEPSPETEPEPPRAEEPAPQTAPAGPVTIIPVPVSPGTIIAQAGNQTSASTAPASAIGQPRAAAQPVPAPRPLLAPPAPETQPAQDTPGGGAENATTNSTADSQARTPRTGLPFIRTILGEMRFRFTPGDEIMFPLPGAGWLHVKMFETPLVEAPWGARILFCPVPKSAEWIENANRLGMKILTVSPRWSVQEVFDKLAAAFPRNFRLWNSGRDLVMTRGGIGLTLQSPQTAIVETAGKKTVHLVWTRQTPAVPQLPQGLHEVLEEASVKVIELDAFNELSRLPVRPRESIYVPVATHMDLIRAINPPDPEAFFGKDLPTNLTSLLHLLRGKELLTQGMASASWSGGLGSRIALQVPAWIVSGGASRIILLDRRFADPYLVSVLSREGYTCFILPD